MIARQTLILRITSVYFPLHVLLGMNVDDAATGKGRKGRHRAKAV